MNWNNPTQIPNEKAQVIFHLHEGNPRFGIFKDGHIEESHGEKHKMYEIKKWVYVHEWQMEIYRTRNENKRG